MKQSLIIPVEKLLLFQEKKGAFPPSFWGEIAKKEIYNETKEIDRNLQKLQIEKEKIFQIELKKGIELKEKNIFSPIEVEVEEKIYKIVGELDLLTNKGKISLSQGNLSHLMQIWPEYLIYLHLPLKEKKESILFVKGGKEKEVPIPSIQESLKKYIAYFLKAKKSISFLMPDWAEKIFSRDKDGLKEKMINSLNGKRGFIDPYIQWAVFPEEMNVEKIIKQWSPFLTEVFDPLLSKEKRGQR